MARHASREDPAAPRPPRLPEEVVRIVSIILNASIEPLSPGRTQRVPEIIVHMASTETTTYQDSLNSQYLSNSFSGLHNARSTNSLIVRSYKQATQLYLTRRFKEALDTIEPIVSAQHSEFNGDNTNGYANGDSNSTHSGPAPIAQSSRSTRTKVWVFYLSLLHAIIDMGQEEGRLIFGSTKWRELANRVRDGKVWEDVVQRGYGGSEGEVDQDVIVNLATLLLGHMQNQRLNQQRLETFLATSESNGSSGNLSFAQDGMSTPMSNSSSSPRNLASRLKILELYTLHVLPANDEWDYSKSFIEMNDMLDEERKEAFLNALQSLKEEKNGTAQRERELKEQREREMAEQRKAEEEEARRAEEARKAEETRKLAESEKQKAANLAAANGSTSVPSKPIVKPIASSSHTAAPRHSSKPQKKPPSPPPTFYHRASSMITNLQQMVMQASRNMTGNSMALMRLMMFIVAFLLIIARRDLRMKLKRAMDDGWVKVKETVGMGVKVSYI